MRSSKDNYRQLESLFSLYAALPIRRPLPPFRGWAASPDFVNLIVSHILQKRPSAIVEAGSGISTVLAGYAVIQLGRGHVYSLEHDAAHQRRTMDMVIAHGLSDVVTVINAPLTEVQIDGVSWYWYDISALPSDFLIDLLVVDGPPDDTQRTARYPALSILADRLSPDATILLDDFVRDAEQQAVKLWLKRWPQLSFEHIRTEKGAALLQLSEALNDA